MKILKILLADDDHDDRYFFEKSLNEIPIATELTIVNDGEMLMKYLSNKTNNLPDVLFLDLNMPRKNGFECICEIKEDERLQNMHVIMFSTSFPQDPDYEEGMINTLMNIGATHLIRKAANIEDLKKSIHEALLEIIAIMELGK